MSSTDQPETWKTWGEAVCRAIAEGNTVLAVLFCRKTFERYWPAFMVAGGEVCPEWRQDFESAARKGGADVGSCAGELAAWLIARPQIVPPEPEVFGALVGAMAVGAVGNPGDPWNGAIESVRDAFKRIYSGSIRGTVKAIDDGRAEWKDVQAELEAIARDYGPGAGLGIASRLALEVSTRLAPDPQFETRRDYRAKSKRFEDARLALAKLLDPNAPRAARREREEDDLDPAARAALMRAATGDLQSIEAAKKHFRYIPEADPSYPTTIERHAEFAARHLLCDAESHDLRPGGVTLRSMKRILREFERGLALRE